MAGGTIGLTGLLSVADTSGAAVGQTGFDLHRIINTTTDPYTCTINTTGEAFDVSAFESTSPVAKDMLQGIGVWTASFAGRYPKNAPIAGHEGSVVFANGYVLGTSAWSITLNAETYDDTAMASTPPTWRSFLPGEITGSGSFDVRIDDTTALTALTTGAATFRMNPATTTPNTLAGTIIITGVSPTVARGARNVATYNFVFDGNITGAGDESLFAAGAMTTPDLTEIVLRAEGSRDYTGIGHWTSLTIGAAIGSPIEVSGTLQGSGALTIG